MGKALVIVESPAKAKTINKYLGNDFVVKSSIGHIRDLPTSGSSKTESKPKGRKAASAPEVDKQTKARIQLVNRMGVDPENGWKAHYEILPGKEKVIDELRRLAREADTIYLATDLDREGEAIAWHLRESIGGDDSRYRRVVFNEITKKAIQDAFSEPGELDMNRVNAQQARRFLDRVVGYMVSPLLWQKIARGLSAGRVQSVAVKLIVDREREIRAFIPEEFWEVHANLTTPKSEAVRFEVVKENGETFRPLNKQQTDQALAKLQGATYQVVKRDARPTSTKPGAPFITSTLQQAASTRLGFSVKKTMMMAQRLYEAGYITYMRTDSTNLSADAVSMARGYIEKNFGSQYLPDSPNVYGSKANAQEAHEAIRPSDVKLKATELKGMERDAERLYELIWRQFVACQMPPARYLSTTISVQAGDFELRARGRILQFDGYTKVLPPLGKGGEDEVLPDMQVEQILDLVKLDPKQHFTKPPARYSEASLVKELEKRGIGRPSTYASIISTIQERGYVALNNRRFYAEKMGDIVTERLNESFPNLMDYSFTARMEESLDDVAQGETLWKEVLDKFYADFRKKLEAAGATAEGQGMRANQPTLTDIPCVECGRPMMIRTASTGVFLGCSGYALPPKERCKATVNLVPGNEVAADDEEGESRILRAKRRCPICSTAMDSYLVDERRKLHVCGNNPDCSGFEVEEGQFKIKGYDGPVIECDKCGSEMQLKTGRFGKYFGCTNSACKNTRKLLRSGEAAPPKMDPVLMPELRCEKVDDVYVLRDGASGLFLAASQFPKNRETRAPLVKELLPHAEAIDPKYHFLLSAPVADPDGNPTVVRYSRKSKEQYVQSEIDGKPSGWRAFHDGKNWVVDDGRKGKR
ncbi:type I DNA topoisomerase [Halopseudomonas xiamenensis]|uniref:type I DNA topoisomerase n=1 Tax=Halopseudomonas xiamenensis TaxID=157792 RepID=UPI001623E0B9|nr:type I DNA topoisomerase [Halopseudomonas xiamenensis]